MSNSGGPQTVQVVTAFEDRDETPGRRFFGHLHHHGCQVPKVAVVEGELSERIAESGVKPRRNEDDVGTEAAGCGEQFRSKGAQDLLAARAGGEGTVERCALAGARARFVDAACAGIPWRLMGAEEQDRGVFVENVLRAVSVMDVPVGNQDAFNAMALLGVAGGDCDIVEDAKTHAAVGRSVMAGRTEHAERVVDFSGHHRVDSLQHTADGIQRDFERAGTDDGIAGAEMRRTRSDVAPGQSDVAAGVAERQFVVGRKAGRDLRKDFGQSRGLERVQNGIEAFGAFRVTRSRIVIA